MTILCQSLVFLHDMFGNVQKTDVRFGVGLLSSGDYPKVAIEECLQEVGGEVLHVRICQTRERRKKHQSKEDRNKEKQTQYVVKQQFCSRLPLQLNSKGRQDNARFPLPSHYLFRYLLKS